MTPLGSSQSKGPSHPPRPPTPELEGADEGLPHLLVEQVALAQHLPNAGLAQAGAEAQEARHGVRLQSVRQQVDGLHRGRALKRGVGVSRMQKGGWVGCNVT